MQGEDAGGLYRESIDMMCQELMSSTAPLFIPCPNAREDMGENRDKYVPRPTATRPLHLQMFTFVGMYCAGSLPVCGSLPGLHTAEASLATGKLFGLALRTKVLLKLNLPSIVWKVGVACPALSSLLCAQPRFIPWTDFGARAR